MSTTLKKQIKIAKKSLIKRWIMEPWMHPAPSDITFDDINEQLDNIQKRVDECRKLYPVN